MDVIGLTSLAVAVTVALGVILKECNFFHFKRFKSHCGCCDVNIDTKTPLSSPLSQSPSGVSEINHPALDKLQTFINDKKHEADDIMKVFKRRVSEGDIPTIELPQIKLNI